MRITSSVVAALIIQLLTVGVASAADPADKCESMKNKAAGKYALCLHLARVAAIKSGGAADTAKCEAALAKAWTKATAKGGDACPSENDQVTIQDLIDDGTSVVIDVLAGGGIPGCGDNHVNRIGEHCDGSDLDGHDCASFDYELGPLGCTVDCKFDTSACVPCEGLPHAGACWFLGEQNQSCTEVCAGEGLAYDNRTATYAGSGGTDANCIGILDAFAVGAGGVYSGTGLQGAGCGWDPDGFRVRYSTPPTDAGSRVVTIQRACACQ